MYGIDQGKSERGILDEVMKGGGGGGGWVDVMWWFDFGVSEGDIMGCLLLLMVVMLMEFDIAYGMRGILVGCVWMN